MCPLQYRCTAVRISARRCTLAGSAPKAGLCMPGGPSNQSHQPPRVPGAAGTCGAKALGSRCTGRDGLRFAQGAAGGTEAAAAAHAAQAQRLQSSCPPAHNEPGLRVPAPPHRLCCHGRVGLPAASPGRKAAPGPAGHGADGKHSMEFAWLKVKYNTHTDFVRGPGTAAFVGSD